MFAPGALTANTGTTAGMCFDPLPIVRSLSLSDGFFANLPAWAASMKFSKIQVQAGLKWLSLLRPS